MSDIVKEEEIDLLYLIGLFFKNLKVIFIITVTISFITLVILIISIKIPPEKSFLPNKFTPKSIVMINDSSSSSGFDSIINGTGMGALAGFAGISGGSSKTSDADLAIKLATTNSFISKLDEAFNLSAHYKIIDSKYPKTELKDIINDNLKIEIDKKTKLLVISYTDIDKVLATDIVNKITTLLEDEFDKIDNIQNRDKFSVVQDKIIIIENEMEIIKSEIINFQLKHNILDVEVVFAEVINLISGLQAKLLEKEVEIESYGKATNVKDPVYIRLLNEREAIIKSIKKVETGDVGDYPPIKSLPTLAWKLEELKRKLDVKMIGYKALVQQYETLKLTEEGTGSVFQVIEKATLPEIKSSPSRGKICIIVFFASFFFSLIFILFKEYIAKIKRNPEMINKLRGLST